MKKIPCMFVILIFFIAGSALAHGTGQSLEKKVNGYTIDVGYDAIDKIYADINTRFDFNIWNEDKTAAVDYSHIWVRVAPKDDEGIDLTTYIYRPEFFLPGMSYTFKKSGNYNLTVRFLGEDDNTIAEAEFPLQVEKGELEKKADKQSLYSTLSVGLGGLVIGAFAASLFKKKS